MKEMVFEFGFELEGRSEEERGWKWGREWASKIGGNILVSFSKDIEVWIFECV